jgi:phosphatidylserine decarboxylase
MRYFKTMLEQYRQALLIHGGVLKLCAAALAVRLSRLQIPSRRLRLRIYRTIYGRKYPPLDETEADRPLWAYRSFNALFTRGIRPECRPIPESTHQYLSPCDGTVQDIGRITDDTLLTVKGVEYKVSSLLAQKDARRFHNGHFAIIFLSPRDCHRIFSPQEGYVERLTHVPGFRLLVHPPYQRKEFPVFTLNERVIVRLVTRLGACALVMVAGWGVGNITFPRDTRFKPRRRQMSRRTYSPPLRVKRGEWLATFELGSTAILLTEAASVMTASVSRDAKIKYGQPVFTFRSEQGA